MQRRDFFKVLGSSSVVVATGFQASQALAQSCNEMELATEVEISRNHGHVLELTPALLVQMLRDTKEGEAIMMNIQGQSSHPHTLALEFSSILEIFTDGETVIDSSIDVGHGHQVLIKLVSPAV